MDVDVSHTAQAGQGSQPERNPAVGDPKVDLAHGTPSDVAKSDKPSTPPPSYDTANYRRHFFQLWRKKKPPPSPPASLDDADIIPLASASFINEFLYIWISPLMKLGYQRPLQATDLWKIDEPRTAAVLAEKLESAYLRRQKAAQEYNERLDVGQVQPGRMRRVFWIFMRGSTEEKHARWKNNARKKASLTRVLSEVGGMWFWLGGLSKVVGDMAMLMGPLVSRQLIEYAAAKSAARDAGQPLPYIGPGIGEAIGLCLLTCAASVFTHFFFYRSAATGVLLRAALTTSMYRKALAISNQARVKLNNGKLMAHLSTDISRIDYATQWIHAVWTAPIQIAVCAVLLIVQIGPSALVGLALFAMLVPLQSVIMSWQIRERKKSMHWTDARSRTLQELLGSFAILKYFVFESAYLKRISNIRGNELKGIWKISLIKAFNQSLALSLPTLAAVVSFICYAGLGNGINPARIFTSLSLFQLLRQPLMFLPRALSAAADASNAISRLEEVFEAELRQGGKIVDKGLEDALVVEDATFEWLSAEPDEADVKSAKKGMFTKARTSKKVEMSEKQDFDSATPQAREPFRVVNLNMRVKRGDLVAIVGTVGCGKSSILSGIIGEMRTLKGSVRFGGKVAYCSQSAFIQNATLRDNVLFGQPWDEDRYWKVLEDACLIADCLQLPDGDLTEIGERGINISGGQKQRVNVARALYYDADIVIFDDPLSALDAHIGQAMFDRAMIKMLKGSGKTVILVTHALHILSRVDYVYTIVDGHIVEQGTYQQLADTNGAFALLMRDFGGAKEDTDEKLAGQEEEAIESIAKATVGQDQQQSQREAAYDKSAAKLAAGTGKFEGRLMQQEKRSTGSIGWKVYRAYLSSAKGWITVPLVIASSVLMQGAQVMSALWLTYWENDDFSKPLGFYMGIYATVGVLQAVFTFTMGAYIALLTYFASAGMHHKAIQRIFFAPMSFFHTTPLGRILGVFGKDIDVLDSLLADSLRMATMIFGNVISSVIIVAYFFPYFLIAMVVVIFGYAHFWLYYRASSRELKRLDSMLRGLLYGHFSESLSGLATIRAYDKEEYFKRNNAKFVDLEDRAYLLTTVNQRWLSIRIDAMGSLMTLAVAIMAAVGINGISAAQVGLVLTFTVTMTQSFGMVTRQTAEVENNMNATERIQSYSSDRLPQEAAHSVPDREPAQDWPSAGEIVLDKVTMAYRPELPPVLKQISARILPHEKIGIVGRTGAGKSSIMQALFRMVELSSGQIVIDGVDIAKIGLDTLRSRMAIIPQEPQLFSGTIRSNLDPFSQYDDARLHDAMKRAYLLDDTSSVDHSDEDLSSPERDSTEVRQRFTLETEIDDGGENLSVGERSLVSLARALVKDSQIIVLDECTASVDLETDAKIQQTIGREFADKTLLCIAHRLRTIIGYTRIMVLETGEIVEFGTPLDLFRKEGIFKSLCEQSAIEEADILKAQHQSASHALTVGSK